MSRAERDELRFRAGHLERSNGQVVDTALADERLKSLLAPVTLKAPATGV
jgi:hypothetical protein